MTRCPRTWDQAQSTVMRRSPAHALALVGVWWEYAGGRRLRRPARRLTDTIRSLQSVDMSSPQEKLLTSPDGTEIWAEEAGDRTKPAIVFIHGLACTALAFNAQFADEGLLRTAHLVRYEMRGHGRSGKPEGFDAYASVRHAEDFRTVCEAFELVRPFVLGW